MPEMAVPAALMTNAVSNATLMMQTMATIKNMMMSTIAAILNQETALNQAQQQAELAISKKYVDMLAASV